VILYLSGGHKGRILGLLTGFSTISFLRRLLMDVFPLVFYRPLEPVDPSFKDTYEGILPDFVENVGDRAL
jgi:hypothetical protein